MMDVGGYDIIVPLEWKPAFWEAIIRYFAVVWPDGTYLEAESCNDVQLNRAVLEPISREFFIMPPVSHDKFNDCIHFIGDDKELTIVVDGPDSHHIPRINELIENLKQLWWAAP